MIQVTSPIPLLTAKAASEIVILSGSGPSQSYISQNSKGPPDTDKDDAITQIHHKKVGNLKNTMLDELDSQRRSILV